MNILFRLSNIWKSVYITSDWQMLNYTTKKKKLIKILLFKQKKKKKKKMVRFKSKANLLTWGILLTGTTLPAGDIFETKCNFFIF